LVESVAGSAEPARPKKPALLKGGMILCWIYGIVLGLYVALTPALEQTAARVLTPEDAEFLSAARIFVIPLLVLSIVVAYGLAKDRHWSRWMMMMLLVLAIVLIPPQLANPTDYAISVGVAVFGWWYLYRKGNVVAYYIAIRKNN
jgi:uncharacterized membrane protein YfcA